MIWDCFNLLHLLLELCKVEMLVLGLARLWFAEFAEKLEIPLAFVVTLQHWQVFQGLNAI